MLLRHARALWGAYWWLPALPWIGYAAVLSAIGGARGEHALVALIATLAAYTSASTRRFFLHALPFLLIFLLFDSMRYWRDVGLTPEGVLGCELQSAERRLFGVEVGGHLLTPNQLLARLQHPALDLLCAVPYGTHIAVMLVQWIYLFFHDLPASRRMAWIALGTNALGFLTYHLLPAAPPWYVALHGCAIDLSTSPSPAALARVDALLGIHYFDAMYSRGAAVFGALPSLHVAYPFFALLATYRRASPLSRAAQAGYAALMMFAAIYLDHHWVIDGLLGIAYAGAVALVVHRLLPEQSAPGGARQPAGFARWPLAETSGSQSSSGAPRSAEAQRLQTKRASLRRFR